MTEMQRPQLSIMPEAHRPEDTSLLTLRYFQSFFREPVPSGVHGLLEVFGQGPEEHEKSIA